MRIPTSSGRLEGSVRLAVHAKGPPTSKSSGNLSFHCDVCPIPGPSNRLLNLRSWRAVRRNRQSCLHKGMSQWVQWSWILPLKSRAREIRITTIYDLICPADWAVQVLRVRVYLFSLIRTCPFLSVVFTSTEP